MRPSIDITTPGDSNLPSAHKPQHLKFYPDISLSSSCLRQEESNLYSINDLSLRSSFNPLRTSEPPTEVRPSANNSGRKDPAASPMVIPREQSQPQKSRVCLKEQPREAKGLPGQKFAQNLNPIFDYQQDKENQKSLANRRASRTSCISSKSQVEKEKEQPVHQNQPIYPVCQTSDGKEVRRGYYANNGQMSSFQVEEEVEEKVFISNAKTARVHSSTQKTVQKAATSSHILKEQESYRETRRELTGEFHEVNLHERLSQQHQESTHQALQSIASSFEGTHKVTESGKNSKRAYQSGVNRRTRNILGSLVGETSSQNMKYATNNGPFPRNLLQIFEDRKGSPKQTTSEDELTLEAPPSIPKSSRVFINENHLRKQRLSTSQSGVIGQLAPSRQMSLLNSNTELSLPGSLAQSRAVSRQPSTTQNQRAIKKGMFIEKKPVLADFNLSQSVFLCPPKSKKLATQTTINMEQPPSLGASKSRSSGSQAERNQQEFHPKVLGRPEGQESSHLRMRLQTRQQFNSIGSSSKETSKLSPSQRQLYSQIFNHQQQQESAHNFEMLEELWSLREQNQHLQQLLREKEKLSLYRAIDFLLDTLRQQPFQKQTCEPCLEHFTRMVQGLKESVHTPKAGGDAFIVRLSASNQTQKRSSLVKEPINIQNNSPSDSEKALTQEEAKKQEKPLHHPSLLSSQNKRRHSKKNSLRSSRRGSLKQETPARSGTHGSSPIQLFTDQSKSIAFPGSNSKRLSADKISSSSKKGHQPVQVQSGIKLNFSARETGQPISQTQLKASPAAKEGKPLPASRWALPSGCSKGISQSNKKQTLFSLHSGGHKPRNIVTEESHLISHSQFSQVDMSLSPSNCGGRVLNSNYPPHQHQELADIEEVPNNFYYGVPDDDPDQENLLPLDVVYGGQDEQLLSQDLRMNTTEEFELNKRFSSYLMKQANPNILGHLKQTQIFEQAAEHVSVHVPEPRPNLRVSDCDIIDSTMNRSHFRFGECLEQPKELREDQGPYLPPPQSMNAKYMNQAARLGGNRNEVRRAVLDLDYHNGSENYVSVSQAQDQPEDIQLNSTMQQPEPQPYIIKDQILPVAQSGCPPNMRIRTMPDDPPVKSSDSAFFTEGHQLQNNQPSPIKRFDVAKLQDPPSSHPEDFEATRKQAPALDLRHRNILFFNKPASARHIQSFQVNHYDQKAKAAAAKEPIPLKTDRAHGTSSNMFKEENYVSTKLNQGETDKLKEQRRIAQTRSIFRTFDGRLNKPRLSRKATAPLRKGDGKQIAKCCPPEQRVPTLHTQKSSLTKAGPQHTSQPTFGTLGTQGTAQKNLNAHIGGAQFQQLHSFLRNHTEAAPFQAPEHTSTTNNNFSGVQTQRLTMDEEELAQHVDDNAQMYGSYQQVALAHVNNNRRPTVTSEWPLKQPSIHTSLEDSPEMPSEFPEDENVQGSVEKGSLPQARDSYTIEQLKTQKKSEASFDWRAKVNSQSSYLKDSDKFKTALQSIPGTLPSQMSQGMSQGSSSKRRGSKVEEFKKNLRLDIEGIEAFYEGQYADEQGYLLQEYE